MFLTEQGSPASPDIHLHLRPLPRTRSFLMLVKTRGQYLTGRDSARFSRMNNPLTELIDTAIRPFPEITHSFFKKMKSKQTEHSNTNSTIVKWIPPLSFDPTYTPSLTINWLMPSKLLLAYYGQLLLTSGEKFSSRYQQQQRRMSLTSVTCEAAGA